MPPLIEARDLRIRFGAAEAVRGVDFQIDDGEVLGLLAAVPTLHTDRNSPLAMTGPATPAISQQTRVHASE